MKGSARPSGKRMAKESERARPRDPGLLEASGDVVVVEDELIINLVQAKDNPAVTDHLYFPTKLLMCISTYLHNS
jgi:hypothetical protein